MTPVPSARRRLPLLGCTLAAAVALTLPACGGSGSATAGNTDATPAKHRPGAAAPGGQTCPAQLDAFVISLDGLRRQLAVGLSYEQYAAKVEALRASYAAIPVDRLPLDCLAAGGSAAESAFNKYIDATNAWGECLADATCTTATIEPVLQRKWRAASRFLAQAR